jgi:hypothetical protein
MSDAVHEASQEFWQPPVPLEVAAGVATPEAPVLADTCPSCSTEFLFGSRFCHTCGVHRPAKALAEVKKPSMASEFAAEMVATLQELFKTVADRVSGGRIKIPGWLRYLHFHEIKRLIGLSTASLISFFIGLGCVVGAIGVSIFYKASNLAEFQAVQLWRIQWLLGAMAAFVAGILLKKPYRDEDETD